MGKMLSWAICLLWANCQFGQKIFGQNVFMGKLSYWAWCLWAKCYLGQYIFGHFEKLGILTFNLLIAMMLWIFPNIYVAFFAIILCLPFWKSSFSFGKKIMNRFFEWWCCYYVMRLELFTLVICNLLRTLITYLLYVI